MHLKALEPHPAEQSIPGRRFIRLLFPRTSPLHREPPGTTVLCFAASYSSLPVFRVVVLFFAFRVGCRRPVIFRHLVWQYHHNHYHRSS